MVATGINTKRIRAPKAKLNRSSRTKTSRENRKKAKVRLSVRQFQREIEKAIQSDELFLPKIFDEATIEGMLREDASANQVKRRQRAYTIPVTLNLFVQQVLLKDRGCKDIVAPFNKKRKEQNLREVATNTTSYCEARARIPLSLIKTLTDRTARLATSQITTKERWNGLRVFLVDGLVVNAPDTPENQREYPQSKSQKPGLGFAQIRLCAAICLHSGVVANIQYGPVVGKKTGEVTLFRRMFSFFQPDDLIVADSLFDCYRDYATLIAKGVHILCEKNGKRESPFTGACKVLEETIKELPRPDCDKSRFTQKEWSLLPSTLTVRMIRCRVGGRKSDLILVATLLDSNAYPATEIVKLYKERWEAELDIRSIKSVMGMSWLSCHTAEMLERELMVYILAYNLVRVTMCDAARIGGHQPRDLAFKGAKDAWLHFGDSEREPRSYARLLWQIADAPPRKRPGRKEPRKIKRRNTKYEKMKLPRKLEKAALSP